MLGQKSENGWCFLSRPNLTLLEERTLETEAQLEEVIFHEATHGGLEALIKDKKVSRSLNKLFLEMGGQKGFFRYDQGAGHRRGCAAIPWTSLAGAPSRRANAQPYYYGRGHCVHWSAGIQRFTPAGFWKLLAPFVSGCAILNSGVMSWVKKLTASDMAALARKAREYYFRNQRARESDGMSAFSLRRAGVRSDNRDDSLYSPAVEILAEHGNRLFKASKKNPEAKVAGEQILAFMKNKGLKPAEIAFTGLDRFLTEGVDRAGSVTLRSLTTQVYDG